MTIHHLLSSLKSGNPGGAYSVVRMKPSQELPQNHWELNKEGTVSYNVILEVEYTFLNSTAQTGELWLNVGGDTGVNQE